MCGELLQLSLSLFFRTVFQNVALASFPETHLRVAAFFSKHEGLDLHCYHELEPACGVTTFQSLELQLFAGSVEIAKTKSFVHRLKIGFILTDINKFIDIALKHVPFEGWNEQVFEKTCLEANISIIQGKLLFPRSSTDLMLSFLKRDDEELSNLIKKSDNVNQKYRNRISNAIFDRINLAQQNREAYRKALSLLALPHMAPDNAAMMWNLSDTIWIALNDSSTDINWYTKRITLGFVYSTSLIYWLGDESHELKKTKDFLERRIEDVMEFEMVKGKFRNSKFGQEFMRGPGKVFSFIKAPNVEQK